MHFSKLFSPLMAAFLTVAPVGAAQAQEGPIQTQTEEAAAPKLALNAQEILAKYAVANVTDEYSNYVWYDNQSHVVKDKADFFMALWGEDQVAFTLVTEYMAGSEAAFESLISHILQNRQDWVDVYLNDHMLRIEMTETLGQPDVVTSAETLEKAKKHLLDEKHRPTLVELYLRARLRGALKPEDQGLFEADSFAFDDFVMKGFDEVLPIWERLPSGPKREA